MGALTRIGFSSLRTTLNQLVKASNRMDAEAAYSDQRRVLPPPRALHVEHTSVCNLRCIMCPHYYQKSKLGRHLDFAVIEKLTEILPWVERITVSGGGEPFLYPRLEDALAIYRDYAVSVVATSNLTYLTPAVIDLVRSSFYALNVSVDGATRETFEGIRRGASFDVVLRNIRRVREACPSLCMTMGVTAMRQNLTELPDLVALAAELGFQRVVIGRMITRPDYMSHTADDSILLYPRTANRFLDLAEGMAKDLGVELTRPTRLPEPRVPIDERATMAALDRFPSEQHQQHMHDAWWSKVPAQRRACRSVPVRRRLPLATRPSSSNPIGFDGICDCLFQMPFVNLNGDVTTCSLRSSYSLGNLLEADSFFDIWNGEGIKALRETYWGGALPGHCYNCQYLLLDGAFGRGAIRGALDLDEYASSPYRDGEASAAQRKPM